MITSKSDTSKPAKAAPPRKTSSSTSSNSATAVAEKPALAKKAPRKAASAEGKALFPTDFEETPKMMEPKPIARKTAPKSESAPVTKDSAPISAPTPAPVSAASITPEARQRMICEAAYYRAESRGFVGGDATQDWAEAEAEVDRLLNKATR